MDTPTKTGSDSGKPPHRADIVIPDDDEDDPFKATFTEASDDPKNKDTARIIVAGKSNDDEDDPDKKKRKDDASIQAYNDHIATIEAAEEDEPPKADKGPNTDHQYFNVFHQGRVDKINNHVHMTSKQLEDLVTKAVIENGWDEIWIYNTWSKEINQTLTKQARELCWKMTQTEGHPLYKKPIPIFHEKRISSQIDPLTGRMQVEPWAKKPLLQTFHEADMAWRNWADGAAETLSSWGKTIKSLGFRRGP